MVFNRQVQRDISDGLSLDGDKDRREINPGKADGINGMRVGIGSR
jgi:hypothetical protein